jgi:hypothetical protein
LASRELRSPWTADRFPAFKRNPAPFLEQGFLCDSTFVSASGISFSMPTGSLFASATPAPNCIPLSDGSGTLDAWVSDGSGAFDLQTALDALSNVRGAILFRGAAGWVALLPGTAGQQLASGGAGADPSWVTDGTGGGGTGDFVGPAGATGNALVRFNGTSGKLGKDSSAILSDAGDLSVNSLAVSGAPTTSIVNTTSGHTEMFNLFAPNSGDSNQSYWYFGGAPAAGKCFIFDFYNGTAGAGYADSFLAFAVYGENPQNMFKFGQGGIATFGGNFTTGGSLKTANPSGGTAQTFRLGSIVSAGVTPDGTRYVEAEINGVACKLALVT